MDTNIEYKIPLWRVFNVKTQTYVHGLTAYNRRLLGVRLQDWLNNETLNRKDYRLRQVKVRIGSSLTDWTMHIKAGELSAVVVR